MFGLKASTYNNICAVDSTQNKKDDRLKFILDKVYHVLYIETKRGLTCVRKVTVSLFKKNAEQGDLDIEVFIFFVFYLQIKLESPMVCKCHWKEVVVLLM